jgi:NADH-quinone oxidoreductase subunit F
MEKIISKIERGEGTVRDVDMLDQIAGNIMGQTICALGDAAAMPVQSFVRKFRHEFLEHVERRACPHGDHAWGVVRETHEALIGGVRQ